MKHKYTLKYISENDNCYTLESYNDMGTNEPKSIGEHGLVSFFENSIYNQLSFKIQKNNDLKTTSTLNCRGPLCIILRNNTAKVRNGYFSISKIRRITE